MVVLNREYNTILVFLVKAFVTLVVKYPLNSYDFLKLFSIKI